MIGEHRAQLFHVADHRGHYTTYGIVVKESYRLLHQLAVYLIAQIRDSGKPHVLDQTSPEKLSEPLHEKKRNERKCENTPDVANASRNEGIQVYSVAVPRDLKESQLLSCRLRIQDNVECRPNRKRSEELNRAHRHH